MQKSCCSKASKTHLGIIQNRGKWLGCAMSCQNKAGNCTWFIYWVMPDFSTMIFWLIVAFFSKKTHFVQSYCVCHRKHIYTQTPVNDILIGLARLYQKWQKRRKIILSILMFKNINTRFVVIKQVSD